MGKTALALDWAEAHGAEILSCDAFCVYSGMDVGTAKPTAEERARVPHHGIDVVGADTPYSVAAYTQLAVAVAKDVLSRGRHLLVAGGSGFYLKSFFSAVVDKVAVSAEIRERVGYLLETEGLEGAVEELRRLNPAGLGSLDIRNPRRVARALERCLASGRTLGELEGAFAREESAFTGWAKDVTLLERPRADLHERIARRTREMLEAGLIEEVRALIGEGIRENPTASRAIGYRETLAYLDGTLDRADLEETINRNTRRLVRKQETWFRNQIPVNRRLFPAPGVNPFPTA